MINHLNILKLYKNLILSQSIYKLYMSKLNRLIVGNIFITQIPSAEGNSLKMLQVISTFLSKNSNNKQTSIGRENRQNYLMDMLHSASTFSSKILQKCHYPPKKSLPKTSIYSKASTKREHRRNSLY